MAETVEALVLAQKGFDPSRYRHRAILVVDEKDDVVGKINQASILKALEPKYFEELGINGDMGVHRLSNYFLKSMVDKYDLFKEPFDEACKRAAQLSIEKIMHLPEAGEFIDKDDALGEAIHRLVLGSHQSLLIRDGSKVIGILRLTDVFSAVAAEMNPTESTVR
ncbi:MAG: CBS domain-containing protein [Desulfosarcina sp.]|nr:CBS domain-containing protein [Desulfosarcina sp.]MBC2765995.1 CBS domain-containing protein [Desulfosarcina sp.]